jgi:hypothetical protein
MIVLLMLSPTGKPVDDFGFVRDFDLFRSQKKFTLPGASASPLAKLTHNGQTALCMSRDPALLSVGRLHNRTCSLMAEAQ